MARKVVYVLSDGSKALVTEREDGTGLYLVDVAELEKDA